MARRSVDRSRHDYTSEGSGHGPGDTSPPQTPTNLDSNPGSTNCLLGGLRQTPQSAKPSFLGVKGAYFIAITATANCQNVPQLALQKHWPLVSVVTMMQTEEEKDDM